MRDAAGIGPTLVYCQSMHTSVICWGSSQGLSVAARSGEMSSSMGLWCSARVDTPELGCFIRDGMLGGRG